MAKVVDLIASFDQNTEEYDEFMQGLLVASSDIPFDKNEANIIQNAVISLANTKINHANTRHDGLKILLQILPRCTKDVLLKHGVLWIAKATQTLESVQSSVQELTIACRIIGSLAISCKDIPELQKQISTQNVKQLIAHVSNLESDNRCGATFYLVAVLLHHYPEPCERLQASIRKLILPLVDSKQANLVRSGANCYTLLTRATERSFKPPPNKSTYTAWIYSQAMLCNSLHESMDALFTGLTELDSIEIWNKLDFPDIPEDNVIEYYYGLERRFMNLCVYLATMLRGCGEKNSVSPSNIFGVLCRGLAITPASLGTEDSFRKQMLHLILPKLHTSLFTVLDAFIDGFRKDLIPYVLTIFQLLQQTLTCTGTILENTITLGGSKPFKNVRISVYKCLSMWLAHAGGMSGVEMVSDEFLPHILRDITPERDRVLLTVQKTQNLSKRALKRLRESQYENSTTLGNPENVKDPCLNADLCEEALIALQHIFFSASCRLKQSFHKSVQNVVVPLVYDFYLNASEENFYKRNASCRLHLLKTLKALQLNPHSSIPPPTQYCIEIFSMAQNDVDTKIIQEAKLALAEIEKIVHPSAPTLRLPIVINENNDENEVEVEATAEVEEQNEKTNETCSESSKNVWERFRDDQNASTVVNYNEESVMELNETSNQVEIIKEGKKNVFAAIVGDNEPLQKKQKKSSNLEAIANVEMMEEDPSDESEKNSSVFKDSSARKPETVEPTVMNIETQISQTDSSTMPEKSVPLLSEANNLESRRHTEQPGDKDSASSAKKYSVNQVESIQLSGESSKSGYDSETRRECNSYLTLKEIQPHGSQSPGNENSSQQNKSQELEVEIQSSTECETDKTDVSEMKENIRDKDDSTDDIAMLNLFCDEPKEI